MKNMDIVQARTFITSGAETNGLRLSADAVEAAAATLASSTQFDADAGYYVPMEQGVRAFTVENGKAVDIELVDHILGIIRQFGGKPPAAKPPASTAGTESPEWSTKAYAGVEAMKRRQADANVEKAQKVAAGPNPWRKEHWNLTNQAILRVHLPQVAAQMKARAFG